MPPAEPHVHAWAAMLRVALDDKALNETDKQAIIDSRAGATDPDLVCHVIYVCKIRKAFDRETMKMFFSVHAGAQPALSALCKGIVASGGKQKAGQAPRS